MSDEDKKTVALLSKKIRSMCDVRLIQYYTRNQQDEFIKQLPQSEKEKIEKQITLYKQAREFYRDYVNFFTVFLFLYFIFYIFYYIIKCKNFCDVCDFCDVLFSSSAGLQAEPLHSKSLRLGLSGRRFFASYLSL